MFVLCLGTHCKMQRGCHMMCKPWVLIVGFALRGEEDNCISQYSNTLSYLSVAIVPLNPHKLHVECFYSLPKRDSLLLSLALFPSERGMFPLQPMFMAAQPVLRGNLGVCFVVLLTYLLLPLLLRNWSLRGYFLVEQEEFLACLAHTTDLKPACYEAGVWSTFLYHSTV